MPTTVSNLDVALDLARAGAFVFPCQASGPDRKKPCRGVFWRSVSTRDEREIRRLWDQHPEAVPGIDLARSGLLVVDCDRKLNDGLAWFQGFAELHQDALDDAPQTDTPSGGRHHFYRNTFDPPHGNGRGQLPPKREADVDVRGHGGFVIGPGAVFSDGGAYVGHGSIFDAKDPPPWLVDMLSAPAAPVRPAIAFTVPSEPVSDARLSAYGETALAELLADLAAAPPGTRNEEANRIAFRVGQLVGGGCLVRSSALAALEQAALSWGIRPSDKALGGRGTIARALAAGEKEPRGPVDDPAPNVSIELGSAFDQPIRAVEVMPGGELMDVETGEILKAKAPIPNQEYPDDKLLQVPELICGISEWIMSTSMFPCRLFATAAAIAAVGTAIGRQVYTGTPRTGSALYWMIVAPTASGKDRPQEAIKQLFEAAGIAHLVKSSVSSSAKLGLSLQERPLQIQVIDEVGKVLRKFVGRNASTQELALLDDYCSVWGKNLGSFTPEGVTTRADMMIRRPSLTMFGATTPVNFYSQLRSSQIAGGFLNRFIVLQRFNRVRENPNPLPEDKAPAHLVEAIQKLHTFQDGGIQNPSAVACMPDHVPAMWVVPATARAEEMLTEYRAKARDMVIKSDDDPVLETWARAAEMVKRMSLILACARDWKNVHRAAVQPCDVEFAANMIDWAMETFVDGLRDHMAENDHHANSKMVLGYIRKSGSISRRELVRRVDGRIDGRTLDAILKATEAAGRIEECKVDPSQKGGPPKRVYVYMTPDEE